MFMTKKLIKLSRNKLIQQGIHKTRKAREALAIKQQRKYLVT